LSVLAAEGLDPPFMVQPSGNCFARQEVVAGLDGLPGTLAPDFDLFLAGRKLSGENLAVSDPARDVLPARANRPSISRTACLSISSGFSNRSTISFRLAVRMSPAAKNPHSRPSRCSVLPPCGGASPVLEAMILEPWPAMAQREMTAQDYSCSPRLHSANELDHGGGFSRGRGMKTAGCGRALVEPLAHR